MRNYSADDFNDWVRPFLPKIQFSIVAHTNFRPCNQTLRKIEFRRNTCSEILEKTLKTVSLNLYPSDRKLPFRKRFEYRPYTFTTIEGLNQNLTQEKTMHFNILIGNLPVDFTVQKLMFHFSENWVRKFGQSDDIWIRSVDELVKKDESSTDTPIQVVTRYFQKDAYENKTNAWSTEGTFDTRNIWLPHEALR